MSKQVTVNGNTYTLNQMGDSAPWGEDLSDLLQALVDVSDTIVGPGDILTTNFVVANNVLTPTNVTGLLFDPGLIRSAKITFSCYRSTSTNEVSECSTMLVTYSSTSATWELAQYGVGDSEVIFTILPSGQIQYISSNITGATYSGSLKFNARAFTQ